MVTTFGRAGLNENNTLKKQTDTRNADVGFIKPFAGNTVPDGYLYCDGSAVSRTTYSELFAAIGTIYGAGDGSTTFNVPDLRGYFLRGDGGTNSAAMGTHQTEAINVDRLAFALCCGRNSSITSFAEARDNVIAMPSINGGNNMMPFCADLDSRVSFYGGDAQGQIVTADGDPWENVGSGGTMITPSTSTFRYKDTETRPANFSMKYCIGY